MSRLDLPEDKAEVSMGPLIDCVFLLLIFFLVSTMTRQKDKDIDITLPTSTETERVLPRPDMTVIGITEAGEIFFEGERASQTVLHDELRALSQRNRQQPIRIDADGNAPFRVLAEVLNTCQFFQLTETSLRSYDENYNRN
jgi:biopolymer transport protein ExbD